jgi:predicted signal transduction protein with EAL and GGDEF domain
MILKSIIALAHELGKEVVAEGIETERDAAYLRSIGCEFGQGYYYGEPMSAKDVASLLSALASQRKKKSRSSGSEEEMAPATQDIAPAPAALPPLPAPDAAPSAT